MTKTKKVYLAGHTFKERDGKWVWVGKVTNHTAACRQRDKVRERVQVAGYEVVDTDTEQHGREDDYYGVVQVRPVPLVSVRVKPRCAVGFCKGGEDLLLVVLATSDHAPTGAEKLEVKLYRHDDVDGVDVYELPERGARYKTCFYELEWQGVAADVLKLANYGCKSVEERLRNPQNWRRSERTGEVPRWTYKLEHYVSGNAD